MVLSADSILNESTEVRHQSAESRLRRSPWTLEEYVAAALADGPPFDGGTGGPPVNFEVTCYKCTLRLLGMRSGFLVVVMTARLEIIANAY